MAPPAVAHHYGESFKDGFSRFRHEFTDVTVTTASGDWPLHSLLLASRSEFFHAALAGDFSESRSKTIELHLEKCEEVWPLVVDYFYSDAITVDEGNACALLALSRQLLISQLDGFCTDFLERHLSTANCLSYLRQAVKFNITDLQGRATSLAARGFHLLYDCDVAGLPPSTVLEILRHPDLLVHCEQQVLRCVQRYLATTHVEPADVAAIAHEVRYLYLDNRSLASLADAPQLPAPLLLAGSLARLAAMDSPAALEPASLAAPPRSTYCCDTLYSLPGGSTRLTVLMEDIWPHIAPLCSVRVSGVSEGRPEHVLSSAPDAYFETDESSDPLPWIEVTLPANVRVVSLNKFVFSHGHRRSGYYRLRSFATLTAPGPDGPWTKVQARPGANEAFEVHVARQDQDAPPAWRSIRLQGVDRQEDAVFRLCVRNLRLFGRAEVDLMQQDGAQALELTHRLVAQIQSAQALRAQQSQMAHHGSSGGSAMSPAADAQAPAPAAAAAAVAPGAPPPAAAAAAMVPAPAPAAAGGGGGGDRANAAAAVMAAAGVGRFGGGVMAHPGFVGGGYAPFPRPQAGGGGGGQAR